MDTLMHNPFQSRASSIALSKTRSESLQNSTNYMRSGYDTPSMNTSDWVWNASLSRSFVKNNLMLKITGYDILQQINSITQSYNSQGRTETWVRSIPSYVMATLTYKFHVAPKKK